MHQHQQAQYSATGHLPQPRRSSIQSMLNPSSPDPGSYGYYPAPHSQHAPPPHHMQQQQQQQQQQLGQHQYIHSMQQQPAAPPQHHHQYHPHSHHTQHTQHPPHQDHYHDDDRQYTQQQQQAYPYPPYPQQHHQTASQSQQQRPQQQHLHPPPHVGHQQQSTQQQIYYPSQPAVASTQASSSLSMNAAPYPGGSNALPPISSQSSFRSHGRYSPGAGSSDSTFQTPPSSSLQTPLQTSVLSHHQQPQQRHMHSGGLEPGKQSPVTGAHSHGAISAAVAAGVPLLGSAPPRHSSVEPAMDMRLQSPPVTSVHSYSRPSLTHSSGRPPSPRATAPEFTRSRQASVSVSGHGYHGEYRQHPPEPTVVGGHYEYGHHYPSSYQEQSFSGSQHTAAHLQQQQQQQQKQQKQQLQHQQHQQQQQQQQQQHQQYSSQFSHHSTAPAYMRPSAHEVDRPHPHGMSAQQHYGHPGYHQQPPSPSLQSQQKILSPPHRGSMADVHSGGPRLASSQQQQQQQPPDRPHAENDEALVMNFMSELQMQQQTHGRKQPHKATPHSVVAPPPPPSQHYQQHPQHPPHPQHPQHSQHPQHGQHRQSLHLEHAPLHSDVAQSHARYAPEDHVGYSHTQDVQSSTYRPQVLTPSQSALELTRPQTPPGSVQPSMHLSTQGGDTRQRLAMTPGLGSGPQSPALDAMPSAKPSQASRKISTPSSQTSLPPPRSLSLMNILNAPETEGNDDTTDTEEERDTATLLPPSNTAAEGGRPFPSRSENDRDGNAPVHKDTLHECYLDGQPQKPDGMAEEHRFGQEHVEAVATTTLTPSKPSKEGTPRPSKEKPTKKLAKEKVVKPKADKVEKPKKPKPPSRKKTSASANAIQGVDEAVSSMDSMPAQQSKGTPVQEPQAGNKHPIPESAGESEDKAAKRIRVEGRVAEDGVAHGSPIGIQTNERATVMDPTQSAMMDIDESRKVSQDVAVDRSNGSSRTKEELPSPGVPTGRASSVALPETRVETMQSTTVGTQEAMNVHSPRASTPTQGSLASRYRAPVSDQSAETATGSKNAGDGPDSSGALPPPRDTAKGPKDKKGSKKKPAPEVVQSDEGTGQKPQKTVAVSSENATDKTDVKGSGKPAASRKKPSSASATASSLKDRFSRPAENVGSPKAVVEESKPSDPISADVKIRGSDASLDLFKDKLPKEKHVDHMDIVPDAIAKSKASSLEKSSEPPKDKETARALPSKEAKAEEQGRSKDKEDGALYCICRTPYDPSRFMIACDQCDDWFHGDCVGVAEKEIDLVDQYYCKRCEEKGQDGSRKKKCGREGCQKSAGRKSKYCSKECGLLLAISRIRESQERVFGSTHQQDSILKGDDGSSGQQQQQQQHLQRRRRLTLADLDDRQKLLTLREKMAHVRMVCAVLVEREKQLEICVERQARQDLGKFVAKDGSSQSPSSSLVQEKENERSATAAEEDDDENALRSIVGSKSNSSSKSKSKGPKASKDKDKEMLCGFDYSLVWDDAEDICRAERAALTSLTATPNGSRASSVAPPVQGVVAVVPSKQGAVDPASSNMPSQGGVLESLKSLAVSPQLQAIGVRVCTARRQCDKHTGWQRLKAAELDLEKTLQNKLLRSLKVEVKLVKSRMKRRRNDLSAGILNGTIEH
ncbi:hypothetical protein EC968_001213 [Mortierella alpina]|nr:hypothetical protein EC968_001213 [Mortierella alpina]